MNFRRLFLSVKQEAKHFPANIESKFVVKFESRLTN